MADSVIMSAEEIGRSLRRISHELAEQHQDLSELLLVGIRTRPLRVLGQGCGVQGGHRCDTCNRVCPIDS